MEGVGAAGSEPSPAPPPPLDKAQAKVHLDEPARVLAASWGYSAVQPGQGGTGQGAQSGGNARTALGSGHGSVLRTTRANQPNGNTAAAAAVVQSALLDNAWQWTSRRSCTSTWKKLCHVYAGSLSMEWQRATNWPNMKYAPPEVSELQRLRSMALKSPVVLMANGWLAVAQDEVRGGGGGHEAAASLASASAPKPAKPALAQLDTAKPHQARAPPPPVKRAPPRPLQQRVP